MERKLHFLLKNKNLNQEDANLINVFSTFQGFFVQRNKIKRYSKPHAVILLSLLIAWFSFIIQSRFVQDFIVGWDWTNKRVLIFYFFCIFSFCQEMGLLQTFYKLCLVLQKRILLGYLKWLLFKDGTRLKNCSLNAR